MAGTQFDPAVVDALDEISDEVLERIRDGDRLAPSRHHCRAC